MRRASSSSRVVCADARAMRMSRTGVAEAPGAGADGPVPRSFTVPAAAAARCAARAGGRGAARAACGASRTGCAARSALSFSLVFTGTRPLRPAGPARAAARQDVFGACPPPSAASSWRARGRRRAVRFEGAARRERVAQRSSRSTSRKALDVGPAFFAEVNELFPTL